MSEHLARLGYLTEEQYAEIRGITVATARNERANGRGPDYVKLGARAVYPVKALETWMASRTISTSVPSLPGIRRRRSA